MGIIYACFSIMFYLSMMYLNSFFGYIYEDGQPFLIQISLRLYVCCAYTSYIVPIIAGVFRRKKTKQFTLQIESCVQIMEQLNIPINLSRCFWQQSALILITVTSYNMYCFLMTMNNNAQMYRIFVFTHWIVHFTIKIMIISHVCARTMIEIQDFTLQVIQNPLIFTTNGLFDLDHTLIRSVIGTVATYLVILIQVKNVSQQVLIENSTIWTNNYTEN
ncbi:hypothetical protein HZH68_002314 [Vespula germanica]|uniref:Gustatory receptor n=1 Tax=Vespula germanica TaxID=30212 RepID=A0A834NLL9_VESGE|nr:hypothetical protein HZH68_002314 [Vespula germanica]